MKRRKIKNQKKLINYLIVGAVISILLGVGVQEYKDNQIKKQESNNTKGYVAQNISTLYEPQKEETAEKNKENNGQKENKTTKNELEGEAKYPKEEIPKEYKGYNVTAKLEIPKINLETYILSTYSKNSLNISVTKFWGADPNEKGNFCVAGHNFQNKNMFHNLRKLEKKDRLWITDHEVGKIEYEIYNIYMVEPEDVTCLSQETNRKARSNTHYLHKRFQKKNYRKSEK